MSGGYVVTVTRKTVPMHRGIGHEPSTEREVSRQEVDTPAKLRVATFNAVAELLPPVAYMGTMRVNPAMEEFGPKAIELAMQGSGSLEVNGSTITVKPVEQKDGEGR